MTAKMIQDLFQLFLIFGILFVCFVVFVLGMIYLDRNALLIKKWWGRKLKFIQETNWIGVFLIVGLILLFMCNGPIIIF
jgi:hypothetical protein